MNKGVLKLKRDSFEWYAKISTEEWANLIIYISTYLLFARTWSIMNENLFLSEWNHHGCVTSREMFDFFLLLTRLIRLKAPFKWKRIGGMFCKLHLIFWLKKFPTHGFDRVSSVTLWTDLIPLGHWPFYRIRLLWRSLPIGIFFPPQRYHELSSPHSNWSPQIWVKLSNSDWNETFKISSQFPGCLLGNLEFPAREGFCFT